MGWKWSLISLGLLVVLVVFLFTLRPRSKPMGRWEQVRRTQGASPPPPAPSIATRPQDPWRLK